VLQERIEQIGRIVRELEPVEYPAATPFPPSGPDLAALFTERLNALRAPGDGEPAVIRVADGGEAAAKVAELCRGVPAGEILWSPTTEPASVKPVQPGVAPPPRQHTGEVTLAPRRDHAVGITPAAALIASTGSIILALPRPEEGYASLLVDRHIVVASEDQLLPDLPAFYQRFSARLAAGEKLPNHVCITGCSRTADIEKMLVVPAHGPRQVRVVLSRAPLDWATVLVTCDAIQGCETTSS
jgi:L-lactate utilization protein LutC